MKYIDAELLRKEVEKQMQNIEGLFTEGDNSFYDGQDDAYNHILSFIGSLQQEQPGKELDVTDFCKPVDPNITQCTADHWWEMLGDKEPDKSLEEAAEKYCEKVNHRQTTIITDSFKAGAQWQKVQIMKEAVEGEVIKTDKHTSVRYKAFYGTDRYFYGIADKQFKPGDKVRIIIVKEENK